MSDLAAHPFHTLGPVAAIPNDFDVPYYHDDAKRRDELLRHRLLRRHWARCERKAGAAEDRDQRCRTAV